MCASSGISLVVRALSLRALLVRTLSLRTLMASAGAAAVGNRPTRLRQVLPLDDDAAAFDSRVPPQ
jgi:hypothetical protein